MPLYKKALKFKPEDLKNMSFDECYELLLCFRYLDFRDDHTLSKDFVKASMEQIRNRMLELNENSASYRNFI